jgi:hypothetical protein
MWQLSEKVQRLEQTHEQDQQKIQQLQRRVGETEKAAAEAQQKAKRPAGQRRGRTAPGGYTDRTDRAVGFVFPLRRERIGVSGWVRKRDLR